MLDSSLIFGVAIFSLLFALSALYLQPIIKKLSQRTSGWLPIRVTARVRLNRSSELFIVEVDGCRILIGCGAGEVNKLMILPGSGTGTDHQIAREAG